MTLVWKLLRQHISVPQFVGFFFANLFGMIIVLLGYQFYRDILPVFTAEDSFMKSDYLIVSKKIGTASTFSGRSNSFTAAEVDDLKSQRFVKHSGRFTSTEYKVDANMGISGQTILSSEIFFESVPDAFVDVPLNDWKYREGSREVPIILPRSYINMYNFGFAQTHKLPKISEGLMGMIDFRIFIHHNGVQDEYKGRVIGFSNKLNSILVPQAFMDWSNAYYAPDNQSAPTRLLIEVTNPGNDNIAKYLDQKGYEVESDKLQAEKTTYFLKMLVSLVMVIGLVISALSFYILMLSIYLLVEKNSTKLQNLLLIGYSTSQVARPYQLLTAALNLAVLLITWGVLYMVRHYYMNIVATLFPQVDNGSMLPSLIMGIALFAMVTSINQIAIRRKVKGILN